MSKYSGYKCASCSEVFTDSDDVVVCPVCGAPHHRSCYIDKGGCAASALHAEGKTYEPILDVKPDEQAKDKSLKTCPYCGKEYVGDTCPRCNSGHTYWETQQGQNPFPGGVRFITPEQFRYGGIDPNEKIEETSVKELADYVGPSSGNFIRKWYIMFKNRNSISINFSALFFGPYYYLYRKMWFWGIMYFIFSLIAAVPSYYVLLASYMGKTVNTDVWMNMSQIFSLISFVVKIAASLLFNKLYLSKAQYDITNGKKVGGVSKFAVFAALAATMLFSELFIILL